MTGSEPDSWRGIPINRLFEIRSGTRLEKRNMIPGDTPFIGASETGNGVTCFIGNTNKSADSNSLGVNYNGSPGVTFYHPYRCLFSDDVKHLHLLHHEDSKDVLLCFATIIGMQRAVFTYGYKFNGQRMGPNPILIPVDSDGAPCYSWMEESTRERETAAPQISFVHQLTSHGVCIPHERRVRAQSVR